MLKIRRYIFAGLLVLVPVVFTIWIISWLVQTLDQTILLLPESSRPEAIFGFAIPGLGVIMAFILVVGVGMLASNIFGQKLLASSDVLLSRIPVVRPIYISLKQISETLFSEKGNAFREAVLIEFPRAGVWTIAFITGQPSLTITNSVGKDFVMVYVPTTPNPTGGYFLIVPKSQLKPLDMRVDSALKVVISMGAVSGHVDTKS